MLGHGCPAISRFARPAGWSWLVIAVLLACVGITARADDTSQPSEAADPTALDIQQSSYDVSTKPFEFRSTHAQWPLVPASDPSQLSVTIRSLAKYAGRDLVLVYQLIRVDDGAVVAREQTDLKLNASGDSESISIASSAPPQEGVYEIRCRLAEKSDNIWSRFTRSSDDIATVKTPWLVYLNDRDRQQESVSGSADRIASTLQPRWRKVQTVNRINPNDWQMPAWIPDGATHLVPNVKRVSGSLNLTPWRDETHSNHYQILPGESFVGYLSELAAHQPYQLLIQVGVAEAKQIVDVEPSTIRVEFARSIAFDSVSQAVDLSVQRPLEVIANSANHSKPKRSSVSKLLHYAAAPSEFIRITNQSTDKTVVIDTVTLSKWMSDEAKFQADPIERTITLETSSANWVSALSADYGGLPTQGGYSDRTVMFFRLWKSISRLSLHASWCGYNEIVLPQASGNPQGHRTSMLDSHWRSLANSGPRDWDEWTHNIYDVAYSRWTDSDGVPVIDPSVATNGRDNADFEISPDEYSSTPSFKMLDAMVRTNPPRLIVRESDFPMGFEVTVREAMEEFRLTPQNSVAMAAADGSASDHIHVLIGKGKPSETGLGVTAVPITIVNTAPWASEIKFTFLTDHAGEISIVRDTTSNAAVLDESPVGVRVVSVPPSSIVNLQIRGGTQSVRLKSWNASMVGGKKTLAVLKEYVSEIVAGIGTLALPKDSDQLRNGGFEVAGQVGIVGWMHTQFPSTAVVLDSQEAIEGSHSIRMTADAKSAGRTWLVSELIPVPASGRLAVSLATRANVQPAGSVATVAQQTSPITLGTGKSPPLTTGTQKTLSAPSAADQTQRPTHRVRVSLEGDRLGKPVRFSAEFEVPCDGHWQARRIVLETDQIRVGEIDSLRLTIDSLTPGKLWIDDVHVHDQFPTKAEQSALQGRAFLAIQGLQHGHLKPAAQLMDNDWSKYLLAHPQRKPTRQGIERRESVANRFRDWLPRSIRF